MLGGSTRHLSGKSTRILRSINNDDNDDDDDDAAAAAADADADADAGADADADGLSPQPPLPRRGRGTVRVILPVSWGTVARARSFSRRYASSFAVLACARLRLAAALCRVSSMTAAASPSARSHCDTPSARSAAPTLPSGKGRCFS